jgi:hypothetical protein
MARELLEGEAGKRLRGAMQGLQGFLTQVAGGCVTREFDTPSACSHAWGVGWVFLSEYPE